MCASWVASLFWRLPKDLALSHVEQLQTHSQSETHSRALVLSFAGIKEMCLRALEQLSFAQELSFALESSFAGQGKTSINILATLS
mmetsp:Transcript_115624/g.222849  ORF Transcript_115624/g.222849 Transcript_115624/m.222849 type:complete len:86 (+) Transcript_115624:712-969(+)